MWINKIWASQSMSWWKDGGERRGEPTCTEWHARPSQMYFLNRVINSVGRPGAPSVLHGRDRFSEQLSIFLRVPGPVWAGAVVSTRAVLLPICALSALCTGHSQAEGKIRAVIIGVHGRVSSWSRKSSCKEFQKPKGETDDLPKGRANVLLEMVKYTEKLEKYLC